MKAMMLTGCLLGFSALAIDIQQQPQSLVTSPGETAVFRVEATNALPLSFRWFKNDSASLSDSGGVSGSQTPELTISNVSPAEVGTYRVRISTSGEETNSLTVTLKLNGQLQTWIDAASDGASVPVPAGTYDESVLIDKNLTLNGAGMNSTVVDGNGQWRCFQILSNKNVFISGFAIQQGGGLFIDARGGAVLNFGSLSLSDCVIQDSGGFVQIGGGIYSGSGDLTLSNCVVRRNDSSHQGAGIYFAGGQLVIRTSLISSNSSTHDGGGIHVASGSLDMERSTVDRNGGDGGGGIALGTNATAFIDNSTLSRNDGSESGGGGLRNRGLATLRNSTVSGNKTADGGGAGIANSGVLTLNHCTLTGNQGGDGDGGGVWNFGSGTFSAGNTIVAGNMVGSSSIVSNDVSGTMTSEGYNLIGKTNGMTIVGNVTGNLLGVDPLLGPLQDNDGPTFTHALLTGSPAIDQGTAGGLTADQRGQARPVNDLTIPNAVDGSDIGAFELQTVTPVFPPVVTQQPESRTNLFGTTATFSVVADGTNPKDYQWQLNGTNLVDGGNIAGSTVATLTISNVQRTNAGSYQVIVSNVAGSTNSAAATLSVIGLIQSWVNAATNGQVIPVPAGTYVENVVIDKDVSLVGAGTNLTILDGNQEWRCLEVLSNKNVAVSGFGIRHGHAYNERGGAILNAGTLSLNDCLIQSNGWSAISVLWSGAIASHEGNLLMTNCTVIQNEGNPLQGGGIYLSSGDLTLNNCVVQQNRASRAGGIYFKGGQLTIQHSLIISNLSGLGGGGIFLESGTLNMERSTLDGNGSDGGGGIFVGGSGTALFENSTISRNEGATGGGGGIFNGGTVTLINCTVSGNFCDDGSGGAGISSGFGSSLTLESCTITSNRVSHMSSTRGGGVYGSFVARNTVIAGNYSANLEDIGNDVYGTMTSEGYNLIGNTNGMTIVGNVTGNLLGVDPLLGPLQDNGGPTLTHALLAGSPAIDQGTAGGLTTDQRGLARPVNDLTIPNAVDGSDIGAFELQTVTPVFPPVVTQQPESVTNVVGTIASFNVVADGTDPKEYQWQLNGTNLVDGGSIAGSTASTLTITSVQKTNAGSYQVIVSNVAGSTNSAVATLSVVGLIQSWVNAATNGQVIPVPAGTYVENVVIDTDVSLVGAGPGVTVVDGDFAGRVFVIGTNRNVSMSGLTVQHGGFDYLSNKGGGIYSEGNLSLRDCNVVDNGVWFLDGGGIYSTAGELTLTNCVLRHNNGIQGGGIYSLGGVVVLSGVILAENDATRGGGIFFNGGQLVVQGSLIRSNSSSNGGGGVYLESGTLNVEQSTVDGNGSDGGGGVMVRSSATAVIGNSTISRNEGATGGGGGIFNFGTVMLRNCTVSGNFCDDVSGGAGITALFGSSLTLESCTITSNRVSHMSSTRGGGVYGSFVARNTMITGNKANLVNDGNDVFGTITSLGHNLIGDTNGATITGDLTGTLLGVDPLLGPLQDNGGPTWTHALLTGSPAIDQGTAGGLTTDQRGLARPVNDLTIADAADGSDMGAFELQTVTPVFPPVVTQQPESRTNLLGTTATFSVVADGTDPKDYQWQFNGTNLVDGGSIAGSTAATLTISNVQRTNAGSYQVIVSNVAGSTNSAAAALSVIGLIQSWVNAATNGQVILVPAGTYVENVVIDKDVSLVGAGAGVTIVDGDFAGRVFWVGTNRVVSMSGLTIQRGRESHIDGPSPDFGSGILSAGNLSLSNCVVQDNLAGFTGGGIYATGGALSLERVTLQRNTADRAGGLYFRGTQLSVQASLISSNSSSHGGGGIFLESGALAMEESTVDGNGSDGGGGIRVVSGTSASLANSTISRNFSSVSPGGGIQNGGTMTLKNCTVSGNTTWDGNGAGMQNSGALTLEHCTVTDNGASDASGGGVANDGTLIVQNSMIAGNRVSATRVGPDVLGILASLGHNLIGDTGGSTIVGNTTGNLLGMDPKLGSLQDNGGPTWTHALLAGSPAIDQGSIGGLTADQRGVGRPVDDPAISNAVDGSDIGAFERRALAFSSITWSVDGKIQIQIQGDPGLAYNLEVSSDLIHWQLEAVIVAGPDGLVTYSENISALVPNKFFRLVRP